MASGSFVGSPARHNFSSGEFVRALLGGRRAFVDSALPRAAAQYIAAHREYQVASGHTGLAVVFLAICLLLGVGCVLEMRKLSREF